MVDGQSVTAIDPLSKLVLEVVRLVGLDDTKIQSFTINLFLDIDQQERAGSITGDITPRKPASSWRDVANAPSNVPVLLRLDDGRYAVGVLTVENDLRYQMDPADRRDGCRWLATTRSPYSDYNPPLYPVAWREIEE